MTADNPDGVASIDGLMEPAVLCESVVETIKAEQFLVLPHQEVQNTLNGKPAITIVGSMVCSACNSHTAVAIGLKRE